MHIKQDDRSTNLENKPRPKQWLESNPKQAELYLKVVEFLSLHYIGDDEGYVNTKDMQYRLSNHKSGGYVFVRYYKREQYVLVEVADLSLQIRIDQVEDITNLKNTFIKQQVPNFVFNASRFEECFSDEVAKSMAMNTEQRRKLIQESDKYAKKVEMKTIVFKRSPHVIAERLEVAGDTCEGCGNDAPFTKKKDGKPYLEVHHIKPLSENGEDTLENTIALCPNCHRKAHFCIDSSSFTKELLEKRTNAILDDL